MKENWHNKDLGDKLGAHGSPMDLENAWEVLQAKRKPEKEDRPFFVWWLAGLLLLCSLGGYFVWHKNQIAIPIADVNTTQSVQHSARKKAKNLASIESPKHIVPDSELVEEASSGFSANDKPIKNSSNKRASSHANQIKKPKSITSIIHSKIAIKRPSYIPISSRVITDTNEVNNRETKKQPGVLKDTSFNNSISKTAVQRITSLNFDLQILDLIKLNNLLIPTTETFINSKLQFPRKKAIDFISISSGYGLHKTGAIHSDEKRLDAISLNLLFGRFLSPKIYIKTGISIQQFTNELKTTEEKNSIQLVDSQLVEINQFLDGTEELVYRTAEAAFLETKKHHIYNRYRFASIPLLLGYKFGTFKTSSLHLEAGISCSIFAHHSGKINNLGLLQHFEDLPAFSINKFGVLQGVYNINYQFGFDERSKWSLSTGMQGSFQLNEIGKSESLNFEKFRAFQLLLGLRYEL